MATVDVLDWNKNKVGSVELNADVFDTKVRKEILHSIVRWQLAKRRQGTHQAKTKAYVSGGGKKPFKQKGTGNARQGSSRSPLNEGGGVIFGPKPRDYSYNIPKKVRQLGLKSALSHLKNEGKLFVVDSMSSDAGKAKELAARLKAFGIKKAVLVDENANESFRRASNNIPGFVFYKTAGVNVYDLLKYDSAILTKDTVAALEARCGVGK